MSEWKETEIGKVPLNWHVATVDEIKSKEPKSIISGPFGSNISSKFFVLSGIPVIRGNNLSLETGTKFVDDGFVFITEQKANELGTWASTDDLVFTAAGTIGQVGILTDKQRYRTYIISNKQLRVRLDTSIVHPSFAYYWFASPKMVDTITQRDTGSTVPLINLTVLKGLPVPIPPLPEQRAIAGVLSSLDDKIDLLHRQNKTLEGIAEALWRKMFVEEAGPGGKKGKLGDFGQIICGKTPSKKVAEYFGGHIPFIKIPDMHGNAFIFETADSLTEVGEKSQQVKTIPARSICVSCIATVGLVCMNAFDSQTNQQINTIIPNKETHRYFLFLLLRNMTDELLALASGGTATDNLNTGDFSRIEISIPPENTLKLFDSLVRDFFEKIYINSIQFRTLSRLRDTVLPKLMSGKVRVRI